MLQMKQTYYYFIELKICFKILYLWNIKGGKQLQKYFNVIYSLGWHGTNVPKVLLCLANYVFTSIYDTYPIYNVKRKSTVAVHVLLILTMYVP